MYASVKLCVCVCIYIYIYFEVGDYAYFKLTMIELLHLSKKKKFPSLPFVGFAFHLLNISIFRSKD